MTRLLTPNADKFLPVQAPAAGDVLGDKYRVEREIGSGGMGIVYEVTHLVMTKKRFAVKWLLPLPDGYQGEDAQAAARRFVREAEIAGGICHPNVVEVYDVTVSDSGCFMVMELLEGESLETRLKRDGKLPVSEACRIIVACASGVGAAHAASVIHRDLKPANIFLMHVSDAALTRPKVLDFGISRFTAPNGSVQSTVTRAGTLIGTPMYMAPEQLRGFECDARTDVYGLGVTLYEALAGKPAYQAPTHADLVVRILTGDATDLRELEPSVPAGLSAVVMRALHHKPEQRFATVQALAEALQPYLDSSGKDAVPGAAPSGTRPRPRPRRVAWAIALVVVGGVLALSAFAARWASTHARESEALVAPAVQVPAPSANELALPKPQEPHASVAAGAPGANPAQPSAAGDENNPQPQAAVEGTLQPPAAAEKPPQPAAAAAENLPTSPKTKAPRRHALAAPAAESGKQRPVKGASTEATRPPPRVPQTEQPARSPKPRPALDSL